MSEALNATNRWGYLNRGYRKLIVSDDIEYYRLASFSSGPETKIRMQILAPFSIKFDCKPQKFYRNGEKCINVRNSGETVINPGFPALPFVIVYGQGEGYLTIGGTTVMFKDTFSGPIKLDCDIQNALDGRNKEIYAPVFPSIPNGISEITWSGGVERIDLYPRWWTL